jgi:signal transduction histidine kinase
MTATPLSPSSTLSSAWRRLAVSMVRWFHAYANWLVGISWKRFFVLALLLLIGSSILSELPPFSWTIRETVTMVPRDPPKPPKAPQPPTARETPSAAKSTPEPAAGKAGKPAEPDKADPGEIEISIGRDGVRIRKGASAASASRAAASAASAAAEVNELAASAAERGVHIVLPPGATSEAVREAAETARREIMDAIDEARREAQEAADEARRDAEAVQAGADLPPKTRVHKVRLGDQLPTLAMLWIVASIITKITYKGRLQAEVKAAQATETAESESLKRQVVEARMAAMQAQVEPHFLFNTLASIDHLIETDPPRASQMQKNLIALLRASMPTLREAQPGAHNLGREMAVIKPYLEILKVRMEERLQTEVHVPDGLLSAEFPAMMIQSLVENAIKHGLEPKPEGGRLTVRAEIHHGKLAVTVADTGLGFGKAATAGTGVGLNNIRERLKLLYGSKAAMTVGDNTPSGTVVTLTVPYLAQAREGEAA